jgi:hypothetical protein
MDIHKAKPWRGGREFVKEIGTIVIGVLIALAGEQGVEALHGRHQANAGEAVLREAFVREVNNAALREAQDACVAARLATLSSVVQKGTETGRLPPIGAIGHPAFTPWTVGAWPALVADQTVSHLPRAQAIAYTAIVQQTAYLSGLSDREEDQWALLDSTVGPGRRLSDVEAQQLRVTLAAATDSNILMRRTSGNLRDAIKETGLVEAPAFSAAAKRAQDSTSNAAICQPIAASR